MKTSSFLATVKTGFLGLLLLLAACKQNNNEVVTPKPDSALTCAGKNLRMTALTTNRPVDFDGDGTPDTDLMPFLKACLRDNTINFEKGGKLSGSEGQNQCPAADSDGVGNVKPGTWTYNPETKILRIVYNGDASDAIDWKVIELSASTMKVSLVLVSDEDESRSLTMIMTYQAV